MRNDDPPAPDVAALVQAAGAGQRLGLGPKAFLTLGGRTLLERAVETMAAVGRQVAVAVAPPDVERARRLCGQNALVVAGGDTRRETLEILAGATNAPMLLVHDVVHPFVTASLARRVIDAARKWGAASAAAPTGTGGYQRAPDGSPLRLPPGPVWLTRKPIALRRVDFESGCAQLGTRVTGAGSIIAAAGVRHVLVDCEPWNIKVTTAQDWLLAQALEQWLAGFDGPRSIDRRPPGNERAAS